MNRVTTSLRFLQFAVPVLFLASAPALPAQTDVAGRWEGAIELPGTRLAVMIDLSRSGGGDWSGVIDIPAQGARDLPLTGIELDERSIRFSIRGVPGDPTFRGTVSDDGSEITGDFTQGGQTFPFQLARAGDPEIQDATPTTDEAFAGFDELVHQTMDRWEVPGMAVAVVKDDSVVLARGYGYRDLENELPVTPGTQFAIGSASKAFTVMILGMLVDEGLLEWDEPVRTYLPNFELRDEFASQRMTPLDLVIHNSGLPRHDLMWYGSDLSRAELFRRLRHLEPSADFRARFQYQNLMFMTAGYLAGQVTGSSWEALVRERIFDPLDMETSDLSIEVMKENADHAVGYRETDEEEKEAEDVAGTNGQEEAERPAVERMPFRNIDNVGPAGSINSSVTEMANWVKLHLREGRVGDRQLISTTTLQKMHSPQIVVEGGLFSALFQQPEMPYLMYGMGWFVQPYRGHPMIHHGGNIDGFSALVSFLPRDGIGLVVLTNLNANPAPTVVALNIYDRLLGLDEIDWNARYDQLWTRIQDAEERGGEFESIDRKTGTEPSHPLGDYVGTYSHPAYGPVRIGLEDGSLQATYNGMSSPLEHWHYDIFRTVEEPLDGVSVVFEMNMKGDIQRISAPLEPNVDPIEFERQPPEEMSDPEFLRRFVGEYEMMGVTARVALRGPNTLTVTIPGQPTYELEPYRGTEFQLKGMKGYSVRFRVEDGEVRQAIFIQPNGVFAADRR